MTIVYFTVEEILRLHYQLIEDFGGSHGVRDEGRLKSVIQAPQLAAFGTEQYTTLFEKAAVYLRNITGDHPFVDGNKRTALTICGIFLARNGQALNVDSRELEEFTIQVAVDHVDIATIAIWLQSKSKQ